jgi:hypothetical protein
LSQKLYRIANRRIWSHLYVSVDNPRTQYHYCPSELHLSPQAAADALKVADLALNVKVLTYVGANRLVDIGPFFDTLLLAEYLEDVR